MNSRLLLAFIIGLMSLVTKSVSTVLLEARFASWKESRAFLEDPLPPFRSRFARVFVHQASYHHTM
jgi:hypothetical protein